MKNFFKTIGNWLPLHRSSVSPLIEQENSLGVDDQPKSGTRRNGLFQRDDELRHSLVKPRPTHLQERRYVIAQDAAEVDLAFFRLRDGILRALGVAYTERGVSPITGLRVETGVLPPKRPYIFLDPWDATGWLIEKTPTGIFIAPADKIVERNTFVRRAPFDVVTVFKPENGDGLYRVSSTRAKERLMSLALYQELLIKELKLTEYTHNIIY